MFCNKTNADGVSLHQFPADESVRRQWIAFVRTKREPNSWTPGSGHICSDHFSADDYEVFGAKVAGFSSKLVLKKSAVPSIQASPTPEQINCSKLEDYFLATDALFLPFHRLAVSTLTPCNK